MKIYACTLSDNSFVQIGSATYDQAYLLRLQYPWPEATYRILVVSEDSFDVWQDAESRLVLPTSPPWWQIKVWAKDRARERWAGSVEVAKGIVVEEERLLLLSRLVERDRWNAMHKNMQAFVRLRKPIKKRRARAL